MYFQIESTNTQLLNILYMFFIAHKIQLYFLQNTYLNPTNLN
jgi:hypothetical protein